MDRRQFILDVGRTTAAAAVTAAIPGLARAAAVSKEFTLAAFGDCILSRRISALQDPMFLELVQLARSATCTWANCEHPLVDIRQAYPEDYGQDFPIYCEPWGADELKWLGVDCVGLANNHTRDYGVEGIFSTLRNLERVNIGYAGSGKNLELAAAPGYIDTAGGRVGQVNFAASYHFGSHASMPHPYVNGRPGLNPLRKKNTIQIREAHFAALKEIRADLFKFFDVTIKPEKEDQGAEGKSQEPTKEGETKEQELHFVDRKFVPGEKFEYRETMEDEDVQRITDAIRVARRNARIVIASIHEHSGRDEKKYPQHMLEELARACIDAGADVFFGTGPHRLWGIEIYKNKPIFYSIGNFIFHNGGGGQYPPELYRRSDLPYDTRDTTLLDEKIIKEHFSKDCYWQSIVPLITYSNENELKEIKLYPISLGKNEPIFRQGTPSLADKTEAETIITYLAEISQPYKTTIEFKKGTGVIKL